MSAPKSVAALAVLEEAEANTYEALSERVCAARDAVRELVEAASALVDSQCGPWERGNAYISARGAENMNAAMKKTRAALAGVGGAA